MAMERWRPSRVVEEMNRMMEDMEDMERHMAEDIGLPFWPRRMRGRRAPGERMAWAPSVNICEKADRLIVRAEIPGVNKDNIDISMTGEMLTIRGERATPADFKDEECLRSEIAYGNFSRSIMLPAPVDAEKIEATYENGMLELNLPKVKAAVPAKIQVRAR